LAIKAAQLHHKTYTSALQIRLAGAKGVLQVNPRLQGLQVQLRSSQIKFPSNDLSFNVIRCSTYSLGFLNRQMIILLHCLGVPEEFFIERQRQALQFLNVTEMANLVKLAQKLNLIKIK